MRRRASAANVGGKAPDVRRKFPRVFGGRGLLHFVLIAVAGAGVVALLVFQGPNWGDVGHAFAEMS